MKSNTKFLNISLTLCSAVLLWTSTAQGVVVSGTSASIYDLFPRNTQGTNGIRLQYRTGGTSTYTDLNYSSDYLWNTPGTLYNLPLINRSAGTIGANPSAVNDVGFNRDPVIRVAVQSKFNRVHIQGTAGKTGGSVIWYIYKGSTNWGSPLWSSSSPASFDFEVDCASGEELFFAVNANGNDLGDYSYWQNITLTAVAFPISATATSVYDLFPRNTQGTNGIRLQNRSPGSSTYADMSLIGDYSWGTPAYHYNFPTLARFTAGSILAQPLGSGTSVDSILRVQVDAACARIRVQGSAAYNVNPVTYYIYKGATNWANPLWQSGGNTSFDFEVVCEAGDELFFGVNAADDGDIATCWLNLTLTGIPPPPPLSAYHAIELGWPSVSNRWYQVQYRTNLSSGNWTILGTNMLGNGTNISVFDTCRYSNQRFYRVIEVP
jgi:hypothetical protein